MAARLAGQDLQQHVHLRAVVVSARHGHAGAVLGARDQSIELAVLLWRSAAVVEGRSLSWRAQWTAAPACGLQSTRAVDTARVAPHAARYAHPAGRARARWLSLHRRGETGERSRTARRRRSDERNDPPNR